MTYINQFEISGIPEFYSKGSAGLGEFYYLDNTLAYFPYPEEGAKVIAFPTGANGELLAITAKGFLHSEEFEEPITCSDCGETFPKHLNMTYITVTSFHLYEEEIYLGTEEPLTLSNGVVMGDVQSIRIVEGKKRPFYMARLAVKDITASLGFSYMTVSSLHPFTVEKGDLLCSKGRLVTSQRGINAICPHCAYTNIIVSDSTVLQAGGVQSLNIPKSFFENDFERNYATKDTHK